MKSIVYSGALITVLSLGGAARAQFPGDGAEALASIDEHVPVTLSLAAVSLDDAVVTTDEHGAVVTADQQLKRASEQAARLSQDQLQRAQEQVKRATEQAQLAADQAQRAGADAVGIKGERLNQILKRATVTYDPFGRNHGERALIIRSTGADAKTLETSEEDLNIMARILEKAASHSGEDEQQQAMGIKLVNLFGQNNRNLLIEGYGAIFMLNVNFPLAGPASKGEENTAKEPSNSTWDEAKQELYGPPGGTDGNPFGAPFPKEEYNPKRVEKLKDSLLEALKNATNMHNLKSDESVTIMVRSGGGSAYVTDKPGYSSNFGDFKVGTTTTVRSNHEGPMGGGGSNLTMRVRKSEIDAFAKGKLNLDEFRGKVSTLVY